MEATYKKHVLHFKRPSGTSRGIMNEKETWFLILKENNRVGIGECGILRGLSIDDCPEYEEMLKWTCDNISLGLEILMGKLVKYPSIQFGLEQAFISLKSQNPFILFPSEFTLKEKQIAINGLIWMGDENYMHKQIEEMLKWTCDNISLGLEILMGKLVKYPSIQFGLEQAYVSLKSQNPFILFPSEFTTKEKPIAINGLIWMGDENFMHEQIEEKLKSGFDCIKMKVGAIDFESELQLIRSIRATYSKDEIELRVDANGAFNQHEALLRLERLAELELHSIEQPIKPNQWDLMRELCEKSSLPIALDEELIGIFDVEEKRQMLDTIRPQYIILKPSLIGGFKGATEWIAIAEEYKIGWWVTSALESNIGLNAIAQWTFTLGNLMPQGLGTGGLYTNNFESPLQVADGHIFYGKDLSWQPNLIEQLCI